MSSSGEDDAVFAALHAALEQAFPGRTLDEQTSFRGPVRETLPNFRAFHLVGGAGEPHVYATIGAWEATRDEGEGVEFLLLARDARPTHFDALATTSYYHSFYGLDVGSTMRTGAWWVPEANTDRFLVSKVERIASSLASLDAGGRKVRYLWLRPITKDEEELAKKQGSTVLEERLDAAGADHLDLGRASVA